MPTSTDCGGLHCPGCGHGRGGAGLFVLVIVLLAAAAAVRAAWHAIVGALEVAVYTAASIAAVGMVAAAVYAAARVRRHVLEVRARRIPPRVRAVITDVKAGRPVAIPADPARPALEAPRIDVDRCPYASCHHNAPEALPVWRRGGAEGGWS